MAFENIIGQERVKRFFARTLASSRASHAYLFVGQGGVGKGAMALEVAKGLLTSGDKPEEVKGTDRIANLKHPDVHIIFPAPAKISDDDYVKIIHSIVENPYCRAQPWANPSISIDRIRDLRRKAAYKSFEGHGRVCIIWDCDRLTVEASNALLKILEEPPDNMYLLMTSSRPNVLLPTITSRCHLVKFDPLPAVELEKALIATETVDAQRARLCARLAGGSYRRCLELAREGVDEMQTRALEFFRKSIQNRFVQVCFVDEILDHFQRDLKSIKELLAYLLIWFRDALVYRESGGESEFLILQDHIEVVQKFNRSFPNADLNAATNEIERSLELMDRNVQINLILIVLLNRLRAFVRR
ncbi:MAG: ATP-binding protein [bacterium]